METAPLKTICIGLPTYRRPEDLQVLLNAFVPLLADRPHIRICVVNDGSHDDTYEHVLPSPRPAWLEYRVLKANIGCGGARRAAFADAREDYVVSIDDDCLPSERWLSYLEALINTNPAIDFFAGDVRPRWARPPTSFQEDLAVLDEMSWIAFMADGLMTSVTANMAMKREAYERAGGFLGDIRGAEDCDMTQRLIASGAVCRVCREWVIGHFGRLRYAEMSRRYRSYGLHAARYVLVRQNWRVAAHLSKNRQETGKYLFAAFGNALHDARKKGLPRWRRYRRAFNAISFLAQLQIGWRIGLRREGRRSGLTMPQMPPLTSRFSDFG